MCKKILMSILLVFTLLSFSCQMAGGESEVDSAHSDWNTIEAFGEFVRVSSTSHQAVTYPFNLSYLNTNLNFTAELENYYSYWRSKYLKPGMTVSIGGSYEPTLYIHCDGTGATTLATSESMGYGLLVAAMMPDGLVNVNSDYTNGSTTVPENTQETFNRLYRFTRAFTNSRVPEFMDWGVAPGFTAAYPRGSATDGDLDIAYALLLAHDRWGSSGSDYNYLQEALAIIGKINSELVSDNAPRIITTGSEVGGVFDDQDTRSSDWMTGQLKAMGEAAGISRLSGEVVNTIYDVYYAEITSEYGNWSDPKNPSGPTVPTGLICDFIDSQLDGQDNWIGIEPADPVKFGPLDEPSYDFYGENSVRVPLRFSIDAGFYQDQRAKDALSTMLNFVVNVNPDPRGGDWHPSGLYYWYELDGTVPAECTDPTWGPWTTAQDMIAPFACAAAVMGNYDTQLANWVKYMDRRNYTAEVLKEAGLDGYYNETISMLSFIFVSGHWGHPSQGQTPQPLTPSGGRMDTTQVVNMNSPTFNQIEHCWDNRPETVLGFIDRTHISGDPWLILEYTNLNTITKIEIDWRNPFYGINYAVSARNASNQGWQANWTENIETNGGKDIITFNPPVSANEIGLLMRSSYSNNGGGSTEAYFGIEQITAYGY